jgi:hypothetical protein
MDRKEFTRYHGMSAVHVEELPIYKLEDAVGIIERKAYIARHEAEAVCTTVLGGRWFVLIEDAQAMNEFPTMRHIRYVVPHGVKYSSITFYPNDKVGEDGHGGFYTVEIETLSLIDYWINLFANEIKDDQSKRELFDGVRGWAERETQYRIACAKTALAGQELDLNEKWQSRRNMEFAIKAIKDVIGKEMSEDVAQKA